MSEQPTPTDSVGQEDVVTTIFVFPADKTAVSNWDDAARCGLYMEEDGQSTFHIVANVAGLRSLARHCLTLAQNGQEDGHVDFDGDSGWFETQEHGLRISRGWD